MEPTPRLRPVSHNEKTASAPVTNNGPELPLHHDNDDHGTRLGGLQRAWKGLEGQLVAYNLEARGIQRVEPEERQDLHLLGYSQVAIMWFSVNLAANNITLGMLGPAVFTLGFLDSCMLSIFGALVGCLVVSYVATFGPKSGNRTMIFSRYAGHYEAGNTADGRIGTSWAGGLPRLLSSLTSSYCWAMQ
jgi:hypothetical protein